MIKNMGEPRIKMVSMPKDTNAAGNIFGGWILSQIDLAGMIAARELAAERVVTVCMDEVIFDEPVFIGDIISCYAKVTQVGNTSISTKVIVVASRFDTSLGVFKDITVTNAHVTYVSVTRGGDKKPISAEIKKSHGF